MLTASSLCDVMMRQEVFMGRMTVFFSDQLLDEIDRQAKQEGINRRALIQAVMRKYIDAKEKRKKMQEACRRMDALARKLGKWNPQATIRRFRDSNLKNGS